MFNGTNTILSVVYLIIFPLAGYLVGGINPAIVLSNLIYRQDIRTVGSKNPGFTNFKRVFGNRYAWFVFFLDIGKSALVCGLAKLFFGMAFSEGQFGVALTGLFAMLGHSYPIWYRFKGGKGFLVAASAIWFIDWRVALIATAIMMLLLFTVKYMSLSVIVAGISCPISLAFFCPAAGWQGTGIATFVCVLLSVLLMTYRHKSNIRRLIAGTESRFSLFGKSKRPAETETTATETVKENNE
ncbi:MAG: glycerol-3-phosphate acyltransferase [Candidatus Borkfalkiaceae bacterium]|nr:glycerol-3-phosphate acyltransferase [Christensenellaceae bacterium]